MHKIENLINKKELQNLGHLPLSYNYKLMIKFTGRIKIFVHIRFIHCTVRSKII
jgi:hypothetical protein